jgi:hypothetical protein
MLESTFLSGSVPLRFAPPPDLLRDTLLQGDNMCGLAALPASTIVTYGETTSGLQRSEVTQGGNLCVCYNFATPR